MAELHATLKPGKLLIGGEWLAAASGKTRPTVNPATEQEITQFADGDAADVDAAVKAARKAFDEGPWTQKMTAAERGRALNRLAQLIAGPHRDELAELETLDSGKPISETKNIDIPMVAEMFEYFAGWATKITGHTIPPRGPYFTYTLREAIGVVGIITPWNFPMLLASWKLGAALAAGNTVVHKPAEQTPLTALRLGQLALDAGIPPGVLNVVTGDGPNAGRPLVRHPLVDKISFTGSTRVGQEIMRESAETLKRLTLELGGKSPNVIFADADLEAAARGAATGIFYNKGEVCAAGSRLFVEESVKDALLDKLKARADAMKQGDTMDPKTRLGPQVSDVQRKRVLGYIEAGKAEGARLVTGGVAPEGRGYFVKPTIFEGTNDMTIAREEIFGPVVVAVPFKDYDDAVRQSNASAYGLAAGVWTRDLKKAHRYARAVKAGTVWVNTYNLYDPAMPFGGYKASGFGRELGEEAVLNYTETKSVWIDLS